MSTLHSKPLVVSFLTCDGVHIDHASGKYYLMGIFSNIRARKFPVAHPQMFWFLILTDVTPGKHKLKITLGLPTEKPVMALERGFESQSPLHRIHLINEIKNLRFEQEGNYSLIVEINDEPIMVTSFGISQ